MPKIEQDWERALLYLYVKAKGPPGEMSDVECLAELLGWNVERAERAFSEAQNRGMASRDA